MKTSHDTMRGRSRAVQEQFNGDDTYTAARYAVRAAARHEYTARRLIVDYAQYNGLDAALVAAGPVAAEAEQILNAPVEQEFKLSSSRYPLSWTMAAYGSWNAHDSVWGESNAFTLDEDPDNATLFRLGWRWGSEKIRGLSDTVGQWLTMVGMANASLVRCDPTSNIFLNEGTAQLWRRVTGVGSQDQLFDESHARIGVGVDGTTAENRQTNGGLVGGTTTFRGMETGFPTVTQSTSSSEGSKSTYKAVFETTAANHDHKEWAIDNKNDPAGTGGTLDAGTVTMNRKIQDFGTKASGSTWTYTMDLRID